MGVLTADRVAEVLRKGGSARMPDKVKPRFRVGDLVLTRNLNPAGHTRLPRYARGRSGVIDCDHGVFIFPDTHAATGEKVPQRLYSVRFTAETLWGSDAPSMYDAVYVDLFESYLEPAS